MTTDVDLLAAATTTPASDPLSTLVGEGKKFKDVAALAAAKVESDQFIEQLKAENAQMRGDLGKASTGGNTDAIVQTLIERIEKATTAKPGEQKASDLSREEIEKLVRDGITQEQTASTKRANYTKANAELLNHFKGDAAAAANHLKSRVESLGMSKEALTELASTNPKMFRELMVPQHRGPTGSVTTLPPGSGALPDTGSEKRGQAYYSKLRKDMGSKFWDPAIQQRMFQDRKALGAEFNTN